MSSVEASNQRPLRADAERNRRRILEAARRTFAERGLDVTLDEIARQADVGVGTVYRRFADKEQLIDALFEDRVAELAAMAQKALDAEDAWEGLEGFLREGLTLHLDDRAMKQILFSTAHGRDRVARVRQRMAPLVIALVERAHAAGALRSDVTATDLPVVQLMLSAVVDYTAQVRPEVVQRMLGIVLDGLRPERTATTPLGVAPMSLSELDEVMACGHVPRAAVARPRTP